MLVKDRQFELVRRTHEKNEVFHRGERWAIWQFDPMAPSFEVSEADHVVADLKTGPARCEFVLYKFVPQVTDKPFGDPIEVDDRFQSEMMVAVSNTRTGSIFNCL